MSERPLPFQSIAEVAARYRSGRLSPVEVTRLCLDRIAAFDGALNAFVTVREEAALDAAREAERALRAGHDRGPLHGIPVAVKDIIHMAGEPTGYGSHAAFVERPDEDATAVARLRAAGAVILGKTNLLEFAYGAVHPDVGQTNNPWDLGRTSGGSSGGSAAGVAAGLCYAALGTDTGGSIRGPAAYCGIAGLKPSHGLVPADGVLPLSWSLDHVGPLARSCADAAALLAVLSGRDVPIGPPRAASLRLGILTQHRTAAAIRTDVRDAFNEGCRVLQQAGAQLYELDLPDLELACDSLLMILLPEASVVHADRLARQAESYGPQTRAQIEQGFLVPAVTYVRAQQYRQRLRSGYLGLFDRVHAILSPAVAWVAPEADPPVNADEGFDEMLFLAPYNLVGMPAVSVPCGTGEGGLPVGLQIAGPPSADAAVLSIGALVERLMPAELPPRYVPAS
jgi:aspartyl-tRNA(Asn)/glutamyl-tRNA(Gln) amidotransferase subunit A